MKPMKNIVSLLLILLTLITLFSSELLAKEREKRGAKKAGSHGNYQVAVNDSTRTNSGITIIPTASKDHVMIFDMEGNVLHSWGIDATRARLLPNCNLLVVHGSPFGKKKKPWADLLPVVREYDFEGNTLWEYRGPRRAHHDIQRLENGNTLFIYRTPLRYNVKTKEFYEFHGPGEDGDIENAKNGRTEKTPEDERRIHSDTLLEVTPDGKIAWKWNSYEHMDIHSCGRKKCKPIEDKIWRTQPRDWTHMNTATIIPENKWFDAGDKRFRPGNIMIMPRSWWNAFIIDKATKEIVWEYGGDYKGGIHAPHEAHMIPKGLPGAGNVLIFDNGTRRERSHSIALEIDPTTKKIVWFYEDEKNFYSSAQGSLQRLPNGNTLISEDVGGDVLEVTPEKEIVWHFKSGKRLMRAHRHDPKTCPQLKLSS